MVVTLLIGSAAVAAELPSAGPPSVGLLRVGTSGDYRPFSFHDESGTVTGFDVVVARRLARDLGRRLELVAFRWPELTSQLQAGAFDIAMSGVTVRPERVLQLGFTRPYAFTGAVAVIRTRDRSKFSHLGDLDRPDVRIAVNAGGHLEQVARQRFPRAQLTTVTDNTALPTLLLSKGADAAISEELEARTWPTKELVTLEPFTHDRKAYLARRDEGDLLRRVNAWLVAREADGWLNAQRRKWFGAQTLMTPQQAGFAALVAAMDLRLQLMPFVAAVKQREHVPIHDAAQEARVLAHVHEAAVAEHVNADDVVQLFRVQMDAAKVIEGHAAPVTTDAALADVRAAVAAVSDEIVTELARCAPWLREPPLRDQLDRMLRKALAEAGLPKQTINALSRAACRVRMAPL